MKYTIKQEKGAFGMEVVKALAFGVLILFIIAYIIVVLAQNLSDTIVNTGTSTSGSIGVANETFTAVGNSTFVNASISGLAGASCTFNSFYNATGGVIIPSSNVTVSGCSIKAVAGSPFQGRNWKVDYSYTKDVVSDAGQKIQVMANDTIDAVSSISSNYSTWFQIGSIVVIVALFSVVLFYLDVDAKKGDMGGA